MPRSAYGNLRSRPRSTTEMDKKQLKKLREEAQQCFRVADRTVDKVAAALLAYACQLEQRARLIESTRKLGRRISGDQAEHRRV
jgi:hypothetical protein